MSWAQRLKRVFQIDIYSSPECGCAMIHARIERLVFGAHDPKTGAAGGRINLINDSAHNHQVEFEGGVLEEDCGEALRSFFRSRRDC